MSCVLWLLYLNGVGSELCVRLRVCLLVNMLGFCMSSPESLCSVRIRAVCLAAEFECMWVWKVGEFGSEWYPLSVLAVCLLCMARGWFRWVFVSEGWFVVSVLRKGGG